MVDVSSLMSGRRAFLGLGGALGLGVAGAYAASALESPEVAAECVGGRDPGELAAYQKRSLKVASLGQAPELFRSRFVTREQWGADESLRFDASGAEVWPATFWPVQTFTVHHSADAEPNPDPRIRMQNIYRYHAVTQGWGDFGYHFAIDDQGTVYEGRYSGEDGVPGFDANGQMVNAAHVTGYNAGNVGVVLLGDFSTAEPSKAAYRSLVHLLTGLTRWQGVDPLARIDYVNPISQVTATVDAISGHRDWGATLCPGETFYPLLGRLRQDVKH